MAASKKKGRKPRAIDETDRSAMLESLLIQGEIVTDEQGKQSRVYPTSCEIAKRLNVSKSWVSKFAGLNKCFERREQFKAKVRGKVAEQLIEAEARRVAFDTDQQLALCDEILTQYRDVIQERGVGNVTSTDVNNLIRLRRLLQGEADSRSEMGASVTLERIQAAYAQSVDGYDNTSPQERGCTESSQANLGLTRPVSLRQHPEQRQA